MDDGSTRATQAFARVVRDPVRLLLPAAVVAAGTELATCLVDLVHAWTVPTLLRDGVFTFAGPSSAAAAVQVAVVLPLAVVMTVAVAVVGLLAAAGELGHEVTVRTVLREVRRRWALMAGLSLLLLGAVLVAGFVAPFVGRVLVPPRAPGVALLLVLAVLAVAVCVLVGSVFVAALVQGMTVRAAGRQVRMNARSSLAAKSYRGSARLVLAVLVVTVVLTYPIGRIAADLAPPGGDALAAVLRVAVGSLALATACVGLVRGHVAARHAVTKIVERDSLPWLGLDRCAPAHPSASRAAGAAALPTWARARIAWPAVVGVWGTVPLAILGIVAVNPTPAIEPIAAPELDGSLHQPMPVSLEDGVAIVGHGLDLVLCPDSEDGCYTADWSSDLTAAAFAADPAGPGVVVLANAGLDDAHELVLITCVPAECAEAEGEATRAVLGPSVSLEFGHFALAAWDGSYAVVHPTASDRVGGVELGLTRCATAACRAPRTVPLGDADFYDDVDARFGPDGTLWVLQTTSDEGLVRLRSFAPDSTSSRDAITIEVPARERGEWDHDEPPLALDLEVREDGTPVVLYRDTADGALVVVGCEDPRCVDATSTRLRIEPEDAWKADLAVDTTGRPLIVTVGEDARLHSCVDRACTSVRTGLLSVTTEPASYTGTTEQPFLMLDAQDRPVFLLDERSEYGKLRCAEPRCGL